MNSRPTTRTRSVSEPPQQTYQPPPLTPLEEEINRLQSRLDRLKAEVDQARRLAVLGSVTIKIAHEFRNWTTPVLNRVKIALETNSEEDIQKALKVTQNAVKVLCNFAEHILSLGSARQANRESVCLRDAVESTRNGMCREFEKDGIKFVNDVPEQTRVFIDSLQIQQVFFVLFNNAQDAFTKSRKTGRVVVNAERSGERVLVTIRDTGPGVPKELVDRLFEPFETSKSIQDGKGNIGIGLTVCRELVEENDGVISVASEEGVGTTFTIDLPAGRA